MEKKSYRVRDIVPETPKGFYDAVERSLAVCHTGKKERTWSVGRLPKRILIPLVAAAVLLITGTAVAAGVLLRDNYSPINYLDETKAEREQKGEAIPDVEAAIASAAPETKAYSITMLPDLPEAELLNGYRQAQGQGAGCGTSNRRSGRCSTTGATARLPCGCIRTTACALTGRARTRGSGWKR